MEALTIITLDTEEMRVYKAASAKRIESYTDRELFEQLFKTFTYIAGDVGFNIPANWDEIVVRLTAIIRKFYNDLTIEDIVTAWQMLIMGGLDGYLPKDNNGNADRKHYQQFNFEYIAKVLNAYTKERVRVSAKIRNSQKEEKHTSEAEKDYYLNALKENIRYAFLRYKYCGRFEMTGVEEMMAYRMLMDDAEIDGADQMQIIASDMQNVVNLSQNAQARRKALKKEFDYMIFNEIQMQL